MNAEELRLAVARQAAEWHARNLPADSDRQAPATRREPDRSEPCPWSWLA